MHVLLCLLGGVDFTRTCESVAHKISLQGKSGEHHLDQNIRPPAPNGLFLFSYKKKSVKQSSRLNT